MNKLSPHTLLLLLSCVSFINGQQNTYQQYQNFYPQYLQYQPNSQSFQHQQQPQQQPYSPQQHVPLQTTTNNRRQPSRPLPTSQHQKPQSLDNRFNPDSMLSDDPSGNYDITTRSPFNKKRVSSTSTTTPQAIVTRFDDINSRKISWDELLSMNTEKFSFQLFFTLEAYERGNIIISPYAIHSLLVVLAEGARGLTYTEINNSLGLVDRARARDFHQYTNIALNKSASDVILRKFSTMIVDENRPVGRDFEDIIEKIYEVDYNQVNFKDVVGTLRKINGEISRETNGQINDVVTRDDLLKAQMLLISGVYFKGNWKSVFNKTFTKNEPFYDYQQQAVIGRVNMMFQRGPFAYIADQKLGSYVVELPYGSSEKNDDRGISMIVVLPKIGLELSEAINNVNTYGLKSLLVELKNSKEEYDEDEVEVHLPRFEMDSSLNLVEALQWMDIKSVFDQNTADLSGINNQYYVSSILHKTKIRVDEKGSEASAVASAIFANKATPPKFHANRPFIYFIVDKSTRLILFAGAYRTPSII